MMMIWGLDGQI